MANFDRNNLNPLVRWWLDIDKINFLLIVSLLIFGSMISISASSAVAKRIGSDKLFFIKKQIIFSAAAFILLVGISFLNQESAKIFAKLALLMTAFLLVMVLAVGDEVKGAKRWITILGFTLQPSEFAKTLFAVFNAYLLAKFYQGYKGYQLSIFCYLSILGLLILQPDFGMSLTFSAIWFVQLFVFGLSLGVIIFLGVAAVGAGFSAYFVFPHVADRINLFFGADEKNYQIERSLDAFINGSLLGTGPGNGVVKKYIPDAHSDFVFPVIAEEYGVLTCILIVLIFGYLITRIVHRVYEEEDRFTSLALIGLMAQFSIQAIINMGVSLSLLPTKGMTLPFISYGGSSTLSMAICFGMILALTKHKYHAKVDYGNMRML